MTPDADTHTAATAYGEVEVEVVECSSCGAKVARDSAEPFTIGEDPIVREGWACEHCADDGPAGFPVDQMSDPEASLGSAVTLWPLLFPFGTMHVLVGTAVSDRIRPYIAGCLGTLVWLALFALVFSAAGPSGAESGVPPI
jgi:hypothetical protein